MHQSIPAAPSPLPPPPPGYCGAFTRLVCPGGEHERILRGSGVGHLPIPLPPGFRQERGVGPFQT